MHVKLNASDLELVDYITCWSDNYTMRELLKMPHHQLFEIAREIEREIAGKY